MKRVWIVPRTPTAKIAQRMGFIVAIIMILFPPWTAVGGHGMPEFGGFHPLWDSPHFEMLLGFCSCNFWSLQLSPKRRCDFSIGLLKEARPTDHSLTDSSFCARLDTPSAKR